MLTLFMPPSGGPPRIQQRFSSPSAYLDHWAVMRLSEEDALRDRFISALKTRGGTLLLWALNLAEFRTCSVETAERAELFLDEVLSAAYFTTMDIEQVLAQEPVPRGLSNTLAPPPDLEMLRQIASRSSSLAQPYSLRGYLRAAAETDRPGGKNRGHAALLRGCRVVGIRCGGAAKTCLIHLHSP
jgi:hypothetical protein